MNTATLRLLPLIIAFAWAQVCCCHAWTATAAAQRMLVPAAAAAMCEDAAVHTCCGEREREPAPELPCEDHDGCAACNVQLATELEGAQRDKADIGVLMVAGLADAVLHGAQRQLAATGGQYAHPPPTLLRLRCALLI